MISMNNSLLGHSLSQFLRGIYSGIKSKTRSAQQPRVLPPISFFSFVNVEQCVYIYTLFINRNHTYRYIYVYIDIYLIFKLRSFLKKHRFKTSLRDI